MDVTDTPPLPLRSNLSEEWMLKDGIHFLNHGSFGAVPRRVFEAQTQWRQTIEAEPVEMLGRRNSSLIAEAKRPIAQFLGMKEAHFGFVTNATEGINAILRSLMFEPGEELLATNHVYHAVRQTLRLAARRTGASFREIELPVASMSAASLESEVLQALSPKTRLLVIDHITSPTALVFPIERIIAGCRSRGVEVLVDGAHAPGTLALNIESLGATYYSANLHKWVCAPKGSAFVWVTGNRRQSIHPAVVSHYLDDGFVPEFAWQGTRDISGWLTTPAALNFMGDFGWDSVMEHNHALAAWAHRLLVRAFNVEPISPLEGSLIGAMATVRLPPPLDSLTQDQIDVLQRRLYTEFGIEVPVICWKGHNLLRVSCQVYNRPEQYEKLAEVILKIAKWRL